MAALSFSVFRKKVESGAKRQTIRAKRKYPIKKGDKLFLWWKQRSSERAKLGEAICTSVQDVTIEVKWVRVGDLLISGDIALDRFAIADGFDNFGYMIDFFSDTHGLPFTGDLIKWDEII